MTKPVCVITGVGPGNGAALARKMSNGGYTVAMLARSSERLNELEAAVPESKGYATDVGQVDSVRETFRRVRADLGPIDTLIHNAGSGVFGAFLSVSAEQMEESWRTNTLGLFACGQEATSDMLNTGRGNVMVIGATAALRGGANFTAFASAKAAQRSLTQSMARTLGPQGIHVAYFVIDGVIDIPNTRAMMPDQPDSFFLSPADIADSVWNVMQQNRSAWTFELDLRPFGERW